MLLSLGIEFVPTLNHRIDDFFEESVAFLVAASDPDSKMRTKNSRLDRVRQRVASARLDILQLLEELGSQDLRTCCEVRADMFASKQARRGCVKDSGLTLRIRLLWPSVKGGYSVKLMKRKLSVSCTYPESVVK